MVSWARGSFQLELGAINLVGRMRSESENDKPSYATRLLAFLYMYPARILFFHNSAMQS